MKRKLYSLLLMAAIVVAPAILSSFNAPTGKGDWVTFSDKKKAKFEVQFPEKPKTSKDKTSWFISATLDEPLTNFYVSVTFYATPFTDESFRNKSKKYMDAVAKIYNETFADPTEIQFNGLCEEYSYSAMGMKSVKRIFYKDNIMYELTVNPILGEVPKDQMDKFFASFKFLP